jgi:hypothetical protein
MLRQRLVPILLAFLLLLSQQLAIAHAVSHLSSDLAPSTSHDKHLPGAMQCDRCLSFASIGSALPTPPLCFFFDLPPSRVAVGTPAGQFLSRTICAFNSRAPPVLSL